MAYSSSGKTHVEESDNLDSVVIYLKKIFRYDAGKINPRLSL